MTRHTKIVATMGPGVHSYEKISELVKMGLDVARLNFSHDVYDAHKQRVEWIRQAAKEHNKTIAILQDLQGPKIRTGKLKNDESVDLITGNDFTITIDDILGDESIVGTTYKNIVSDVKEGDRILISDGNIELKVKSVDEKKVLTRVIHGGVLINNQGINLPGVDISLPSLTEKDRKDLEFGMSLDVDFVALSFVRSPKDILIAKKMIAAAGSKAQVVAKLERSEAIDLIDEILDVTDAVMVARGDMGVELEQEQVPLVQKQIISKANEKSIPVITATHMMESMCSNPRPTRAEITDVANAVLDGTDAVMLSKETSMGKYPEKAILTMQKIAMEIETSGTKIGINGKNLWEMEMAGTEDAPKAIGAAVSTIVSKLPIKAIWALTLTGSSARLISHFRSNVPIYAFTPNCQVARQLKLVWGVTPIKVNYFRELPEFLAQVKDRLEEFGVTDKSDNVIITGGHPTEESVETNFLKIYQPGIG